MRRSRILAALATAFMVAVAPPAAAAQDTPKEYADEWTEQKRGPRSTLRRIGEQVMTSPMDRLFGPAADGPMNVIINRIIDRVEAMYRERRDPCLAAAVNMAHYQVVVTTGRKEVIRGATEMFFNAAGGAAGGRNLAESLGRQLAAQIKDKLQDAALDKFKEKMREKLREGQPVYFTDNDTRGDCEIEFRIVWRKATEDYEFLVAGDCKCKQVSCGQQGGTAPLRRWTITGKGTVVPDITQDRDGSKRITYAISAPQDIAITADCCRGEGEDRFRLHPPESAGNRWVGVVQVPPSPTPSTPQQPRRPQTGSDPPAPPGTTGTSSGTAKRPPRSTPIDIPEIPDGPLTEAQIEDLEGRIFRAEERARSERREAENRLTELQRSNAAPEAIAEAQAAATAAAETHREAGQALEKLKDKVNQQQPQEEQSSVPPDPASATILALHNSLRGEVGVPPLKWDRRLAANALVWATHLARTGQMIHAPRDNRSIERENLNQGLLHWSPTQMMDNWMREKQNFFAGVYPNVTRTGRWQDVSHYTQVIWPTTTHVGCGIARGSGFQWLVCRYSPGGNKDGKPVGFRPQQT